MKLSHITLAAPAALLLAGIALAADDPDAGGIERMPPGAEAPAPSAPATAAEGASAAAQPPADEAVSSAPAGGDGTLPASHDKAKDKDRDEEGASVVPAAPDPDSEPERSRI